MFSLKYTKIETKLRLLVGMSMLGLLSFAVVSYITIAKLKVGGLVQTEIKLYSISPPRRCLRILTSKRCILRLETC